MTMRISSQVAVWDDFDRADGSLGSTPWGLAWKQATANFTISSNAVVKLTGTSTNRYFALLPGPGADIEINAQIHTNPTTNATDLGFALRSLDTTASRGGQLYVSLRKTAAANSIRILHRTDTSGSDTVLASNTSAGWADDTDYTIRIVSSGTSVEVLVDGVSKLSHTLSGGVHSALTGTDVGVSFTNTDTGSRILDFYVLDPSLPTTPVATTTKVLVHRGTPWTEPDTTEEQPTGLAAMPADSNGPEVDARKTSDGDYYLCHDTTFDRTSPTSATGSSVNASTATWVAAGMTELGAYLDACATYGWSDVIVQAEMDTQSDINGLVALINAHAMRGRVIVMTSATAGATPRLAEIRAAGWTGRLGCYGLTTTNWAAGLDDDFTTYSLDDGADMVGFLALGDAGYDANTDLIGTLHAAGHLVGASTITPARFVAAVTAGVDIVLTDYPAEFLAWYAPPANPPLTEPTTGVPHLLLRPRSEFSIDTTFQI